MSKLTERLGQLTRHFGSPSEGRSALNEAIKTLQHLERSNKELVKALNEYSMARAMPTVGDYAGIAWESPAGPIDPSWGGGDCKKHGRWYGRCHSCKADWEDLMKQADRDATQARDKALMAAEVKARATITRMNNPGHEHEH